MKEFIREGLRRLGTGYDSGKIEKLAGYYDELSAWNRKAGFVKAEGKDLVARHIFDSLSAVPVIDRIDAETVADIGSGAGLPGIPLSIFFPDRKFTLVERSSKRAAFLENCRMLLSLDNVEVEEKELESLGRKFDIAVFRAFRDFSQYISLLGMSLNEGGFLCAYKGKLEEIEKEMESAGIAGYRAVKVSVPFMDGERHIVVVGRDAINI